jgi:hypothetical protein
MKNKLLTKFSATAASIALVASFSAAVFAASETELSLPVVAGVKSIDIVDSATGNSVVAPAVSMSSITFSYIDQNSTGTLGTAAETIRTYNPTSGATWTASIAAKDGASAVWQGATYTMDFNDAAGAQLAIDPSTGTITAQGGVTTNVSAGSASAFNQGTVDSITLYSAAAGAATYDYFDLTGVGLDQLVPGNQDVDSYTLDLTLTVA